MQGKRIRQRRDLLVNTNMDFQTMSTGLIMPPVNLTIDGRTKDAF